MKTLTVRLPDALVAEIESESVDLNMSKSDVVRARLQRPLGKLDRGTSPVRAIVDLIGSVDGLPTNLSDNRKQSLKAI